MDELLQKIKYTELPPKEAFYLRLNDRKRGKGNGHISNEEYQHLQLLWKQFGLKTFKDFHIHYLKKDVLFLADLFETFIDTCLKYYDLDPCHYFSAPGLFWDAMFKMTKIELEKINDPEKHIFIEAGMRGGICVVIKRYSKANNKFCSDYDPNKPEIYIKYLDKNNLYGKAMSEYLPYGGFKWIKGNENTIDIVLNKIHNSKYGYFLEVDLECPENFHDEQNDFPMAPEKIKVTEDMLSPFRLDIINEYGIKVGTTNKLIPNLIPKKNYVVHYRNLKYYLSKGRILTKVHKILEFRQSPLMKPYIDFNTQKRMEATNEADKSFLKLMINSVYGKTMENMRKRMKIRIIKNARDHLEYTSRTTYINNKYSGRNLIAIHEKPEVLKLNKPIYVGCAVLDLSKLEMCKFYYDFLKQKCKNFKLIYMDTNSFIIKVIEENFDDIMLENKEHFDLSNFSKDNKYYCIENKKVPDKMKVEYSGKNIIEVATPKPKSYTVVDENNNEKSTHKGHNSNFASSEYRDVVFNKKVLDI